MRQYGYREFAIRQGGRTPCYCCCCQARYRQAKEAFRRNRKRGREEGKRIIKEQTDQ